MKYEIKNCVIVILAAGKSERFGSPKQLIHYRSKSLLLHSVSEAGQATLPLIVVIGANKSLVENELKGQHVLIAENNKWKEGMSSSLHRGLLAAKGLNDSVDAIIFMVSDQPFVSGLLIKNLIETQQKTGLPIVASDYGNGCGVPVLFHKIFFDEILELTGDTGAKKLIEKYKHLAAFVPFPLGKIDIDTIEDYQTLSQQ